jgi:hypothetical protein
MPAFWIGIAMIAYDLLGHFTCLLARLTNNAWIWNSYSRRIFPSLPTEVWYDGYWSCWFSIAIALIVIGHFAGRHALFSPDP